MSDITATRDGTHPTALAGIVDATLSYHGGRTKTLALVDGSPAMNAGNNAHVPADRLDLDGDGDTAEPLPVDQRGGRFARVFGTIDIGAFEAQPSIANDEPQSDDEAIGDSIGVDGGSDWPATFEPLRPFAPEFDGDADFDARTIDFVTLRGDGDKFDYRRPEKLDAVFGDLNFLDEAFTPAGLLSL